MKKHIAEDKAREERITMEIVVDANSPEEQVMGWYCYLQDKISFPFNGRCLAEARSSPLKKGEMVEVTGMASETQRNKGHKEKSP